MTRWLNLAFRKSSLSNHPRHKMAAVVVRGGAVLSAVPNLSRRWCHAEARCLARARGADSNGARGATIFVVHGKGNCSKPCPRCEALIREAGIKKAVYFGTSGQIIEECFA